MATITKSLTIESQGTYNLTFDLWSYSEWAASAGITTSYASLAALIADEKAVRQLMTVHASVDYLANCPDSTTISTIINNNLCAKWINLSDYAFDKLSAKSNIKSVMDTADKYGYGEWGKINSTTWGPLGNVPIMTSNTAPYGVASGWDDETGKEAYKAFDGNPSTYKYHRSAPISGTLTNFIVYKFVNPICIKSVKLHGYTMAGSTYSASTYRAKIKISNDGTNWTNIYEDKSADNPTTERILKCSDNSDYASYVALDVTLTNTTWGMVVYTLQFYGRELKVSVPTMTSNTTPYGKVISCDVALSDFPAWKAFNKVTTGSEMTILSYQEPSPYIGFNFLNPTVVKRVVLTNTGTSGYTDTGEIKTYTLQGRNSDSDAWEAIGNGTGSATAGVTTINDFASNNTPYKQYRIKITDIVGSIGTNSIPIAELQFYGFDYSEKEFAPGSTRKTIYDHGVAPSGAITGGTKNPDCLTLSAVGTATVTINKGTRKYMGGKAGLHASGTNRLKCGSGYSVFTASNMPDSNGFDISSISGSVSVGIEQTASGTFDCTEIWIE